MSSCTQCGNNSCGGCGALTIPEGPVGPQGPAGPAGANGTNGTNGAAGPTWMSWSSSVGSDTQWIPAGGNASFKIAAYYQYPGFNTISIPTFVKVISRGLVATANYDIQLYDVTNAQILASISARTQIVITTDALTVTPNNWPANAATLVIRIRDNQAADNQVGYAAMTWHN